jgi:hypothetical protein
MGIIRSCRLSEPRGPGLDQGESTVHACMPPKPSSKDEEISKSLCEKRHTVTYLPKECCLRHMVEKDGGCLYWEKERVSRV